jgi:hypothetical protein
MVQTYATGKRALGICDRCGFRHLLNELKGEFVQGKSTGSLVCDSCFDPDHPQNFLGLTPVDDPQALRVIRPDVPEAAVPPYVPPKTTFP